MGLGILRNFVKFTGKHLWQGPFFNKAVDMGPEACNLFKKRPCQRCFRLNFSEFLRTPFLQNVSGRLLLSLEIYKSKKKTHNMIS